MVQLSNMTYKIMFILYIYIFKLSWFCKGQLFLLYGQIPLLANMFIFLRRVLKQIQDI